ncbi:MAG: hypothetical protein O2931_11320 [Planctomycetota bacterium]|nr:hypothetical protein [Planctomycetota bacterium]MDA1179375.1 hypothetical protein [Planctomycetota bacterium]
MNLLGKILTVSIFVMSLIFMVASVSVFATHRNWRDLSTKLKEQVSTAQRNNEQLETKLAELLNQLTLERAARASAIAQLETRSQDLTGQLQRATTELQKLQSEEAAQIAMLDQAQKAQSGILSETTRLRDDVLKSQQARDEQFRRAVDLQDLLNKNKIALEAVEQRDQELSARIANMKLLMERGGLDESDALTDVPPRVDGIVTAVRENNKLVEISLGTDEGLRSGHELDVFRSGGTYLGRVVIRHTSSDRSVSEVIPDFRRGLIREGDRVITKVR